MEEELSVAINVPITLIFLMTVLGVIFTTVSITRGVFQSYTTTFDMAVTNAYDSELIELCEYQKSIPASTVYVTLKKNEGVISSISGVASNRQGTSVNITSIESLSLLFDSKVKVSQTKNTDGLYKITIVGG